MADLIPKYRDTPLDSLNVLIEVAHALTAVFQCNDDDLLESENVRSGFGRMASALAESLEEFQGRMGDHLRSTTFLIAERDRARQEADALALKLRRLEAERTPLEGQRAHPAPDLSEPAASDAAGALRGGLAS
ncbi:hypothetical protein [Aquabacter cavernae]|uniref:hypothetical protein n=1 Tax=Aquabacter cavernae TaxID=2496029 RepID=UPI000F8C31EE|nr:hypothetical protein [Aquabacter cavernae]